MNKEIAESIRNANIEVHGREAEIYDAVHPEIYNAIEQEMIWQDLHTVDSILSRNTQVRALDIGCGTGNLALKYLERGYNVTAVDISKEMIEMLRSKLAPDDINRIELVVGDAQTFLEQANHNQFWDLISFSSVLHHLVLTSTIQYFHNRPNICCLLINRVYHQKDFQMLYIVYHRCFH